MEYYTIEHAEEIAAFAEADRRHTPPTGAILFVGSSIFRLWTDLPSQMAPLPVFNRAFGGARTWEVLHYMDQIVLPYQPRIIVYYCGSNDINGGESAEAIVDRISTFQQRIAAELPDTILYFVSVNRAPQKRPQWSVVDAVNGSILSLCKQTPRFRFIDVNPTLLDSNGELLMRLFEQDELHLNPEAYERFAVVVRPELEKAWQEIQETQET